jgi:ribose-phosphate pyrophosphokinase
MKYTGPENLAILACPGGEVFADEVIHHLKKSYHRKLSKSVSDLAKKYDMDAGEVTRRIGFIYEALRDRAGIHTPRFKVPARFILFPNGEIKAEILESIRGRDVYIVQDPENRYPLSFNDGTLLKNLTINDHIMTVLVTVDAVKQAGADRITLVSPVYPYSRQHKKKGREGVTASRIGRILESLGVDRIITLDIHSREIGNGFNFMRIENLHASYQIIRQISHIAEIKDGDFVVVSPDTGAVDRNKFYASAFKKPLALLYKERDYSRVSKDARENNIAEIKLLGKVEGKTVFMADDMLGTGGTLLKAMQFLKEQGAKTVIAAVSLPLFSGNAIEHFDASFRDGLFYRIIGTNAVYQKELLTREWYVSVNITKLFAQTIARLHEGQSLSSLLDNRELIGKMLADG